MKLLFRAVSILVGVLWVGVALRMLPPALRGGDYWSAFAAGVENSRLFGLLIALLTLAGVVLWVVTFRAKPSKPRYLSYETEQGSISISIRALQDFLSNIKGEYESILSLLPHVDAKEDGLSIVLEVNVRSGESVPDLSRSLQNRVRKLVEEKAGISEINSIEVRVEEIVNEKTSKITKAEPVPPPAGETP